jgi:type IV pilus assembly protein PilP
MRHRYLYGITTFTLLSLSFLWGCGDQPTEKSKPLVVSKKISAKDKPKLDAAANETRKDESTKEAVEPDVAGVQTAPKRIYDPAKRLNPFIPLFKPDQDKASAAQPKKSKRGARIPQTPLERISLEQLQLRAVIRAPSGNRALVEDNSGKGYIIKNGTYIGLNSGIVTQINADGNC